MAGQGELVGLFARDAVVRGHALGGEPHGQVGIGIVFFKPGIDGDFIAAHGNHGHGFGAAGDNHFGAAAADALAGQGDGLQAAGAVAIDGHGGRFDGHAGAQRCDARHIHALLAFRHGAAQDHVFDFLRGRAGTRSSAP